MAWVAFAALWLLGGWINPFEHFVPQKREKRHPPIGGLTQRMVESSGSISGVNAYL